LILELAVQDVLSLFSCRVHQFAGRVVDPVYLLHASVNHSESVNDHLVGQEIDSVQYKNTWIGGCGGIGVIRFDSFIEVCAVDFDVDGFIEVVDDLFVDFAGLELDGAGDAGLYDCDADVEAGAGDHGFV
jgi:hypothetical protein